MTLVLRQHHSPCRSPPLSIPHTGLLPQVRSVCDHRPRFRSNRRFGQPFCAGSTIGRIALPNKPSCLRLTRPPGRQSVLGSALGTLGCDHRRQPPLFGYAATLHAVRSCLIAPVLDGLILGEWQQLRCTVVAQSMSRLTMRRRRSPASAHHRASTPCALPSELETGHKPTAPQHFKIKFIRESEHDGGTPFQS